MADIFISYASGDRPRVEPLAKVLEAQGWSVWWDQEIPAGKTWRDVILEALRISRSVIVLWSNLSVNSRWVLDEAEWGFKQQILIPMFIDDVEPPFGFGSIHTIDFKDWVPSKSSPEFDKLILDLESILGPSPLKKKETDAEARQRERQAEEAKRKAIEEEQLSEARRKAEEDLKREEVEEARKQKQAEIEPSPEKDVKEGIENANLQPAKPRAGSKALIIAIAFLAVAVIVAGTWLYLSFVGKPTEPDKRVSNNLGMAFVYIPPGNFTMGSPEDEPGRRVDYETQHQVSLTQGFYMQTTEVTQGQWRKVMNDNPSNFKDCGEDCPVENVSWNDVETFIKKLNTIDKPNTYRLPTEAEWEYAARAGTPTSFAFGACLATDEANYDGNYPLKNCPKGEYRGKTTPVGSLAANAWGLYDMHGNVLEWCSDWYIKDYYKNSPEKDPQGPFNGTSRVLRGGAWGDTAGSCRSAVRDWFGPGIRGDDIGFRPVRLPGQQG